LQGFFTFFSWRVVKESALCAGSTGIGNHLINLLPVAGLLFLLLTGVISHPLCPPLHLTKLIHSSLLSVYILYSHSHPFHFLPPWAHLIAAIDEFNCANYCADFVPQRCCLVPFPQINMELWVLSRCWPDWIEALFMWLEQANRWEGLELASCSSITFIKENCLGNLFHWVNGLTLVAWSQYSILILKMFLF